MNAWELCHEEYFAMWEALEERLAEEPEALWLFCPLCGRKAEIDFLSDGQKEVVCTCGGQFRGFVG